MSRVLTPWKDCLYAIRIRCLNHPTYTRRGIKCHLSMEDIKILWFRDNAFKMEKPSIDRINNEGDYSFNNCRFIELKENVGRQKSLLRLNKNLASSKYKGVVVRKDGYIFSRIIKNRITHHLGYFKSEKEAAIAYNKMASELYGNDAVLNKVEV